MKLLEDFIELAILDIENAVIRANKYNDKVRVEMPEYIDFELNVEFIEDKIYMVNHKANDLKLRINLLSYPYDKNKY